MSRLIGLLGLIFFVACQSDYQRELNEWKIERFNELKAPYGWPSVTGLFPIKVTYQFFGRSDANEFIIPNGPSSFGHLEKTDSSIIMRIYESIDVYVDSQIVRTVTMKNDKDPEGPTIASYRSLQWHIIERDSTSYLRVKDTLSAYRKALTQIPYFPTEKKFVVSAKAIDREGRPGKVKYSNILGHEINREVAAYLSFEWEGVTHELIAYDNDSTTYFVMLNDATTGISTYGGGRYLYPAKPDSSGIVILDFNRLINPPCVFTPYATCPLPPKENHLPFEIKAGEMDMHLY